MSYDNEIWKDIEGYEGLYQVSNSGRVKNIKRNRLLKPFPDKNGYLRVDLFKNSRSSTKSVHRLVAKAFISNPNNLPQVNHKDENPSNNNVENLEWCSTQYNITYGTRSERASKTMLGKYKNDSLFCRCRPIKNSITGEEFYSIREAARRNGISATHIGRIAQGKRKSKKYKFEYI